jgi:hypothetical protein
MLSLASWTMALAVGLTSTSRPVTPAALLDSPHRHVRATQPAVGKLLRRGFEHSPTFAALLRRLEMSDLLVYIEEVPRLPTTLEGRLLIQPPAHGFRYVRIQFQQRGSPSDVIAVLGHELRHAVEVAEAMDVVDAPGLAALYRRIGIDRGNNLFDTLAAQEAGHRVLKELLA